MVDADEHSFAVCASAPIPQLAPVPSTAAPSAVRVENIKDIIDVLSTKGKNLGPQMHDPPRCLIPDWDEAEQSVVITAYGSRCQAKPRARQVALAPWVIQRIQEFQRCTNIRMFALIHCASGTMIRFSTSDADGRLARASGDICEIAF